MPAYSILDNSDEVGSSEGVKEENKPHMTAHLIVKISNSYKSHWSASDFDMGFINRIIEAMKNNQDQQLRIIEELIDTNDNIICMLPHFRSSPTGGLSAGRKLRGLVESGDWCQRSKSSEHYK